MNMNITLALYITIRKSVSLPIEILDRFIKINIILAPEQSLRGNLHHISQSVMMKDR
jgi:hypothetical protein